MEVLDQGVNPIFTDPDPDKAREFFRQKSRAMVDKRMTEKEAVEKFVHDGDYFAAGGFGANRIPNSIIHEIVRQRKKDLGFLGHTSTHDFQVLAAGKCFNRCDAAYIVGLEARGLSPNARKYMQSGERAADRVEQLRSRRPPQSRGRRRLLRHHPQHPRHRHLQDVGRQGHRVPVHRQEVRGRARPAGRMWSPSTCTRPTCTATASSRASRWPTWSWPGPPSASSSPPRRSSATRSSARIPTITSIPFYLVDAVVEAPFGSYPGNMAYCYFSDEVHLAQWLKVEKDPEEFEKFLDHYIYSCANFEEYLEKCGGLKRMEELQKLENVVED